MTDTPLKATAGLPFGRKVRVTDGKDVWPDLSDFEVRMQIRVDADESSRLKYDFTPHLEISFDDNDIIIEWYLTGAETRLLKGGYYDLVISDVGVDDERAIRALQGTFDLDALVTTAEGAT